MVLANPAVSTTTQGPVGFWWAELTHPYLAFTEAGFDAIVVAGGQAPMFSFEGATGLQTKFVEFFEAGKVACALCHGTALLRYAKLASGRPLVEGRTVNHRYLRAMTPSLLTTESSVPFGMSLLG